MPDPVAKTGTSAVHTFTGGYASLPSEYPKKYSVSARNSLIFSVEHAGPPYNSGGPFLLAKWEFVPYVYTVNPVYKISRWYGGQYTVDLQGRRLGLSASTLQSLYSAARQSGASAIARSNPTKPHVDMVTAVGELLTDGLPSIVGTASARNAASSFRGKPLSSLSKDYLSYQFGWLPLVSDVRKFASTVIRADELIRQYERGSGKDQKRQLSIPIDMPDTPSPWTKTSSTPWPTDTAPYGPWGLGTTSASFSVEARSWFEGCFRYYVPKSGLGRYATLARKLYGVRLTPDVLWNLAPWSWAADWFGNVGDVMSNISSLGSDAVALKYGYVMRGLGFHNQITTRVPLTWAGHPKQVTLGARESLVYKTRVPANPYGFSVDVPKLSPRQISILAALGLSRR